MSQWLRAHALLKRPQDLVPSTHVGLTTICDASCVGLVLVSGLCRNCTHMCVHEHKCNYNKNYMYDALHILIC